MAYKALVIDDHGIDTVLKRGLIERGYGIVALTHPCEALDKLREGLRPRLIVSDVESHPGYSGLAFSQDAKLFTNGHSRIFLWSGLYGGLSKAQTGSVDASFHTLYRERVIDGFMGKSYGRESANVMLDLIDSPHFLFFAAKHGIPVSPELKDEEVRQIAEFEALHNFGLNIRF